ncbi:hypothetical protein COHA_001148 [Chlorella ohadii]|uniref:Cystatin domain-containing protein n=1 Tax=Chlorella ohadii TaxID=2649997 RepID=A0AAD5DYC6_9CHLO|nr:hypothetical protein COHA_001148 [Chlorella ohadii]
MARSSTALLALCFCAAAAVAAAAVAPAPNCAATAAGVPGGWQTTESVPDEVYSAMLVSLVENNSTIVWVPCDDPAVTLEQACSQVVAGSNYQVVAQLVCPAPSNSSIQVEAVVYVPLPVNNEEPEVTSLQVLNVDGSPVSPPEVVV